MTALINPQLLLSFAATAALIVIVPGPSVMFIVSRALSFGRPAAMAAAAGNTAGITFQGLLAALGLGTIVSNSDLLYGAIKFGGAVYLLLMGVKMLRNREFSTPTDAAGSEGNRHDARRGFLVGVSNPKIVVFFAAVLPQFVDPARGHVLVQMLVLVVVFAVISLAGDTSWGIAGGSIRSWSATSPRRIERLIGASGTCIIVLGVALALSHNVH